MQVLHFFMYERRFIAFVHAPYPLALSYLRNENIHTTWLNIPNKTNTDNPVITSLPVIFPKNAITGKEKITANEITFAFPSQFSKFIALKGSISVDGISLTISDVSKNTFTVSLIPHTLKNTTLGFKKIGDLVNIEVDMISRYLKRLFDERDKQTDYEFLKERGFI